MRMLEVPHFNTMAFGTAAFPDKYILFLPAILKLCCTLSDNSTKGLSVLRFVVWGYHTSLLYLCIHIWLSAWYLYPWPGLNQLLFWSNRLPLRTGFYAMKDY
jgi:hypothetical protein